MLKPVLLAAVGAALLTSAAGCSSSMNLDGDAGAARHARQRTVLPPPTDDDSPFGSDASTSPIATSDGSGVPTEALDAAATATDSGPDSSHTHFDASSEGLGDAPDLALPDSGAIADAGPPPPPRMDCNGKLGAPGDSVRSYDGRNFLVHIPEDAPPNTALPVLFAVHGQGSNGADMRTGTAFDLLADQQGFVAVFPDGDQSGNSWNVGRGACAPGGFVSGTHDDLAYFEHMLDDLEQDQCIDREHVFVTGFSMGGYFSHHIGCQRGRSLVRAVAPHSGGTYDGDCPGAPLPVLILHGDADPLIPVSCARQARSYWVERNGCASDFDTIDVMGGHCEWQRACPTDSQVVLCEFDGLEHNWAYPPDYDFSTMLIWTFFEAYL